MVKFLIFTLFSFSISGSLYPMEANRDPLAGIHYTKAFNQEKIYEKYSFLMRLMGCADNVFKDEYDFEASSDQYQSHVNYGRIDIGSLKQYADYQECLIAYENECLAKLNSQRNSVILRPARESCMYMLLLSGGMGLLSYLVPEDTGFGLSIAVMNCIYHSKDLIQSISNWYNTRPHPIDRFEQRYARNKCYIPRELWKSIEDEFLKGRGNQYSQSGSISFLQFALGLTVYKPKPPLFKMDPYNGIETLSQKVEAFFTDYEPFAHEHHLNALKASIGDFILGLMGNAERPRYIYLMGPKGLGKTHFARTLNKWVEELLPGSTSYFEQSVMSPAELGGSVGVPGIFLSALRNQCSANKNGSVILIDEASWINDQAYIAEALKVFEDSRLPLRVKYFGEGMEGRGIQLKVPPMLVFLTGNKDIENEALKSRFDCVIFPNPKKTALFNHAYEAILKNHFANSIAGISERGELGEAYNSELREKLDDIDNFRDTASLVRALMVKWFEAHQKKIQ
jgi:hypothetical protein